MAAAGEELELTEGELLSYWVSVVMHSSVLTAGMLLILWVYPWWLTLINASTLILTNWMIYSRNSGSSLVQCRRLEVIEQAKTFLREKPNETGMEAFIGYVIVIDPVIRDPFSFRGVADEVVGAQLFSPFYLYKVARYIWQRARGASISR